MEYEQSVLGSMLIDPAKIPLCMEILCEDDFRQEPHKRMFAACVRMYAARKPIDPITLLEEMGADTPQLRKYVMEIAQLVPSTANAAEYARLVKDDAIRLRAREFAQNLLVTIDNRQPIDECAAVCADAAKSLESDAQRDRVFSYSQLFFRFHARQFEEVKYLRSDIRALDSGAKISAGDYVIVGGRPSSGKTALTIQIALSYAKQRRVVYFSLETDTDKIFERIITCQTGVAFKTIKNRALVTGKPPDQEMTQEFKGIQHAAAAYMNEIGDRLQVVNAAGMTVEQIKASAVNLKADVIFIDYIGLIQNRVQKSLYEKATQISIDLHTMAQQFGLTVFALSQLSRAGADKTAGMETLRDSGQIEQDADLVLLLIRPNEKDGDGKDTRRILRVAKNKEGITGDIEMFFEGATQRFFQTEDMKGG